MAESRLRYDAARAEVERVSDRSDGPDAGVHRCSALEFIARGLDHVPERDEVRVRYCGAYATRRRVGWRRRGVVRAGARGEPPGAALREHVWPARRARRRRWADRLRRVFRVDVERCARGGGAARSIGFVTEHSVITRLLSHLAPRRVAARAGPWVGAAAAASGSRVPRPARRGSGGRRRPGARRQAGVDSGPRVSRFLSLCSSSMRRISARSAADTGTGW